MNALSKMVMAAGLAAAGLAGVCRATDIVAGPMIGQVTDNSVRVWVQINTAERVSIRAVDVVSDRSLGQVTIDVEGPAPFVGDLPMSQLEPNRNYRIELEFDGKPVKLAEPLIVRTAPPAGEVLNFSVALAAGVDLGTDGRKTVPGAAAILASKPQAMMLLGNLGLLPAKEEEYPKTRREAFTEMVKLQQAVRANRDMSAIFRTVPTMGVWGERDFGPENSAKDFVYARESMLAFRRYWPNPMYGTPEARGVFFKSTYGDVDFFVLDSRMQRDPEQGKDPKEMLGAGQVAWLKEELAASKANLKVIACSSPLLADDAGSWGKYASEREDVIDTIQKKQVPGVVLVSAGKYGRLLCRKATDTAGYPLYEMVCPPLSVKAGRAGEETNRLGDPFPGNGFGTLLFAGGSRAKRFVTLQLRDETGNVVRDQTVYAANLAGQ